MIMRIYYIWPRFPSISISGEVCGLDCKHCNRQYLSCMRAATTSEELMTLALEAEKNNAAGLLISGGCDAKGRMINLEKLLPTLKRIKKETELVLKLHTGLVDGALAESIVEAEVDIASMEFVGSDVSVKEIFGLDCGVKGYLDSFINLKDAGMRYISPHVCVGIHYGKLLGEFNALNLLREHIDPDSLVIIVFRPTKGTALEHVPSPAADDVGRFTAHARKLFPEKKILLGSLRPRTTGSGDDGTIRDPRLDIEIAALHNGIDAVEIPSPPFIRIMKERGIRLKRIEAFGVLPEEYEDRIGYSWL